MSDYMTSDCMMPDCVTSDCVTSECVTSDCMMPDCVTCNCVTRECVTYDRPGRRLPTVYLIFIGQQFEQLLLLRQIILELFRLHHRETAIDINSSSSSNTT